MSSFEESDDFELVSIDSKEDTTTLTGATTMTSTEIKDEQKADSKSNERFPGHRPIATEVKLPSIITCNTPSSKYRLVAIGKDNTNDYEVVATSPAKRLSTTRKPSAWYVDAQSRVSQKPDKSSVESEKKGQKREKCHSPLRTVEAIAEAARRSGFHTIRHRSGAGYVIPLTLEANPIRLEDYTPPGQFDILKEDVPYPYCITCHSALRNWRAYEYHVLSVHIKYKAYRCLYCSSAHFFTEQEIILHLRTIHPGKPLSVGKEIDESKEKQTDEAFEVLRMIVRDNKTLTYGKIEQMQSKEMADLQKVPRLRFKVPQIVTRKDTQSNASTQTVNLPVWSRPIPMFHSQDPVYDEQDAEDTPFTGEVNSRAKESSWR